MIEQVSGYALMSVPQMAALLDCDSEIAHAMVDAGTIPSVLVGKRKKGRPGGCGRVRARLQRVDLSGRVLAALRRGADGRKYPPILSPCEAPGCGPMMLARKRAKELEQLARDLER